MKRRKDISDLIRDNQHKLNERPSPRAWRRLESKLDQQHSRHQTSLYKQLAMAAAVIALVAVASLITLTINNQGSEAKMMAEANIPPTSWPVEKLETVYTDANEDLHKVVEFQRSLKRIYASNPNPINEGQRKKVIATNETTSSNNTITNKPISTDAIAKNDAIPSQAAKPEVISKDNRSSYEHIAVESEPEIAEFNDDVMEEEAIASVEHSEPFVLHDQVGTNTTATDNVEVYKESKDRAVVMQGDELENSKLSRASANAAPAAVVPAAKKESNNVQHWFIGNWNRTIQFQDKETQQSFQINYDGNDIYMLLPIAADITHTHKLISFDKNEAYFGLDQNKVVLKKSKDGYTIKIKDKEQTVNKLN